MHECRERMDEQESPTERDQSVEVAGLAAHAQKPVAQGGRTSPIFNTCKIATL